jgi:hypothetical protein
VTEAVSLTTDVDPGAQKLHSAFRPIQTAGASGQMARPIASQGHFLTVDNRVMEGSLPGPITNAA